MSQPIVIRITPDEAAHLEAIVSDAKRVLAKRKSLPAGCSLGYHVERLAACDRFAEQLRERLAELLKVPARDPNEGEPRPSRGELG